MDKKNECQHDSVLRFLDKLREDAKRTGRWPLAWIANPCKQCGEVFADLKVGAD
jgi:predicted Zn-ribbon and HTH transcriptional regulator